MTIRELRNEGIVEDNTNMKNSDLEIVNLSQDEEIPIIKIGPESSEISNPQEVSISQLVQSGAVEAEKPTEDSLKKNFEDTINNGGIQASIERRKEAINHYVQEQALSDNADNTDDNTDTENTTNSSSADELSELEREVLGDDFEEEESNNNQRKEDIKMSDDKTTSVVEEIYENRPQLNDCIMDDSSIKVTEALPDKKIQNAMNREDNKDTDYEKELLQLDSEVVKEEVDENIEILKKLLIEKTNPVKKKLDITGFTVVNRPISLNNSLANVKELGSKRWVLMNTGIPFVMTEFKGDELEELARISRSRSDSAALDTFTMLYNHVASRKPATVQDWMKVISYYDVDHLYMGIYNVCFSDVNYLPYNCVDTKVCKNVWLADFQSVEQMCVFENDEIKKKFYEILEGNTNSDAAVLYVSEIIPVSEKYAFALKEPSVYSMTLGNVVHDQEFYTKYKQVIDILPWIDNIYDIDREAGQLRPVGFKEYPNNEQKTLKAKIITYANIIRRALASDEYTDLITLIAAIDKRGKSLSYCIPETTCPKCKKLFPKEESSAYSLVFTRHRLGAIKNI